VIHYKPVIILKPLQPKQDFSDILSYLLPLALEDKIPLQRFRSKPMDLAWEGLQTIHPNAGYRAPKNRVKIEDFLRNLWGENG
jgi:hypothetical protein